jgi:diguanylate cyclase (GGDEF)-like protein
VLFILTGNYRDFARMVDGQASMKAMSNENFRLANLDSLTGLPNRRQFFARLDEAFQLARTKGHLLAVGILDLDGFKPVNDIYGHAVGDKLLIAVGERLTASCGEGMHLARLGGDEFALIVKDVSDEELLARGAQMCAALRSPFVLPEATVQISASVGFTVFPKLAFTATGLFEQADYALYHSKRTAAATPFCFQPSTRPRSIATRGSNAPCWRPTSTASLRYSSSLSSTLDPEGRSASRRWPAGTARRLAPCLPTSSSPWRNGPVSSAG